jgi:hypothetical protein
MRTRHRRTAFILTSALAAGILLAGCGAGASDTSAGSGSAAEAPNGAQLAAPDQADTQGRSDAQGKDTPAQAPNLSVDQRSIIYRGSISVRVKDVDAAAGEATGIATTYGGFIGSDNRTSDGGAGSATMQLRIPADKFGTAVDRLSKLGKEEHREINTEDVTEETVDLDARITVQQARVDSGRKLLAQAKSLSDLVMLEKEVATRESDLASLQAKKRRLADLTALSTITVTFLGPQAVTPEKKEQPPGFLSGLSSGWHALLASLGVLLTVVGALLPWLIVLGLPAWAVVYLMRRYGKGRFRPALVPAGPPLPSFPPAARTTSAPPAEPAEPTEEPPAPPKE